MPSARPPYERRAKILMGRAEALAFIEYLDSKRTVDDRALNRHVLSTLRSALNPDQHETLKILELGAGIGTMVTRLLDWELLPSSTYTAVDIDPELVREARRRLGRHALKNSLMPGCGLAREIMLRSGDKELSVNFDCADALEYCQRKEVQGTFDLLIAHAFLDLLDLQSALPAILRALKPPGLFYFTLVFDGITHFEPPIDEPFEACIEELYHQTMDERRIDGSPSGDRYSGRHLLGKLREANAEIIAAGPSDWLVHPIGGSYPGREAAFLFHILDMVYAALKDREELDPKQLEKWLQIRRAQVESGDLIYLAHQIDVLGRLAE